MSALSFRGNVEEGEKGLRGNPQGPTQEAIPMGAEDPWR